MAKKIKQKSPPKPEQLTFFYWQKIFIYFYVFSLVGHWVELIWAPIGSWISGWPRFVPEMFFQIVPIAPPYGLGIAAVIVIIKPLIEKFKLHPLGAFGLSVIVTGGVECACGWLLILVYGQNTYWNYSGKTFNLWGQTCLENDLLFGLAAVLFLYYVLPWCEFWLSKFTKKQIETFFWVIFSLFVVDFLYSSAEQTMGKVSQ